MPDSAIISPAANHRWMYGCSVAALTALFAALWMDVIPHGDELQQFPRALHTLDPAWLSHDLFVGAPQGDHWVYFRLVGALFWIAGPYGGAIAARVLIWLLAAASLVMLGKAIRLRPAAIVLGTLLFASVQQFSLAGETLVGEAIARHLAYPFVWFALACWVHGRFGWAAVLLGLATSCHFLVGAWATMAMLLLLPFDARLAGARWKVAVVCGLLFVIASAPGWVAILPLVFEAGREGAAQADRIFVFFRHPHHLHPASWPIADYGYFAATCVLFALLCRVPSLMPTVSRIRGYVRAAVAMTVVALIFGLAFESPSFLKLHPYRIGPPMLALLTSLLLAQWMVQNARPVMRWGGTLGVVVLACYLAPRGSYHFLRHRQFSESSPEAARLDVLHWIRNSSPSGTTVLTNPSWSDVPWEARRAASFSFKLVPFEVPRILEWERRLKTIVELPDGTRPGHEMMAVIGESYDKLSAPELVDRARRVNASLAVGTAPCDAVAASVYENSHYCVYAADAFAPVDQNYLVLRYDDYAPISPYSGPPRQIGTERELFKKVAWNEGVISVGVIPFPLAGSVPANSPISKQEGSAGLHWLDNSEDPWTKLLRDFVHHGVVEPALHGYEHRRRSEPGFRPGEYRRQPESWQRETLQRGREALASALDRPVTVFIPPWNSWDASTVFALDANNFEWLSPDLHHAKFESSTIKTVPQGTFSPAAALEAMKNHTSSPDGSILVLVMHPFDFESSPAVDDYKSGVESVLAYAKAAPAWKSVGFAGLPREPESIWTSRFSAAVEWNGFEQILNDGFDFSRPAPAAVLRPYEWYQDHLWRVRLPVVGLMAGVAALACLISYLLSRAMLGSTVVIAACTAVAVMVVTYLGLGAWRIHSHDYAIRGVRWLALLAAAGCALGLILGMIRNLRSESKRKETSDHMSAPRAAKEPVLIA